MTLSVSQKILKEEYDSVKVTVVEESKPYLDKCFKYRCIPVIRNVRGVYFYAHKRRKPFIFIYKPLPNYAKLWIFLHEKGHYCCDKKQCSCFFKHDESEYHAQKFALEECYKKGYLRSLCYGMTDIVVFSDRKYNEKIVKSKEWNKYHSAIKHMLKPNRS